MKRRRWKRPPVRREFIPVAHMTPKHWEAIRAVARRVLGHTEGLEDSLRARQRIAMYWTTSGELVGLCTIDLVPERFCGHRVLCLFTGNTWLAPICRGRSLIPMLAFQCYLEAELRWPTRDKYWFFGSNSFYSYLIMVRNLPVSYPRRNLVTPLWEMAYLAHLAEYFYGRKVDPRRPVLRQRSGRTFKEIGAGIPEALRRDPDLQYFLELNPGYAEGDKLMCLGPLTPSNWGTILGRAALRALGLLRR